MIDEIKFTRTKDFNLIKELGAGACGKTVLLEDPVLREKFVCKKFHPYPGANRAELFEKFINETKILVRVLHKNIVRVFNWYLFPDEKTGYILMEYIEGQSIDKYIREKPAELENIFAQVVSGFVYLNQEKFLHRDIRQSNILVTNDGIVKIIDFGFGKQVNKKEDFDKSISLNLWCDKPKEYLDGEYTFRTEVYFVGQLFAKILKDNSLTGFKHSQLIEDMCKFDPHVRIHSFADVNLKMQGQRLEEIEFDDEEVDDYRVFSTALSNCITKIREDVEITSSPDELMSSLESVYQKVRLESVIPDPSVIIRCFISGSYYFRKQEFRVYVLRNFLDLMRNASSEKRRIIANNIVAKLEAIQVYKEPENSFADDDLPF